MTAIQTTDAPPHIPDLDDAELRQLRDGVCPGCWGDYLIETDCADEPTGNCPGLICGGCQWGCAA